MENRSAPSNSRVRPMLEFSFKVETTMAVLRLHQFSVTYALRQHDQNDHPLAVVNAQYVRSSEVIPTSSAPLNFNNTTYKIHKINLKVHINVTLGMKSSICRQDGNNKPRTEYRQQP